MTRTDIGPRDAGEFPRPPVNEMVGQKAHIVAGGFFVDGMPLQVERFEIVPGRGLPLLPSLFGGIVPPGNLSDLVAGDGPGLLHGQIAVAPDREAPDPAMNGALKNETLRSGCDAEREPPQLIVTEKHLSPSRRLHGIDPFLRQLRHTDSASVNRRVEKM